MPAEAFPSPEGDRAAPEGLLQFAEFLFSEGEYYRAVTEYRRFLFAFPGHFRVPFARLRIAQAYLEGGEFARALEAAEAMRQVHPLHPLEEEARFVKGVALVRSGRTAEGRDILRELASDTRDEALREKVLQELAASLIRGAEFEAARRVLDRLGALTADIEAAEALLARAGEIPSKSPLLAGTLGALVPGAGHAYVGRQRTALYTFLLTGLLAVATAEAFDDGDTGLGWGLASITALFHGGAVFSAINTAHNHNRTRLVRFQENVLELLEPEPDGPAGAFRIGMHVEWDF